MSNYQHGNQCASSVDGFHVPEKMSSGAILCTACRVVLSPSPLRSPPVELEALRAEHQRLKDAVAKSSALLRETEEWFPPTDDEHYQDAEQRMVNWRTDTGALAAFEAQHPEVVK